MKAVSFNDLFASHPVFKKQHGLFYQAKLGTNTTFEQRYIELRGREGRLYDYEEVKQLPEIDVRNPLSREWKVRKRSTESLIRFLKYEKAEKILEVGCGNGWLIHRIQKAIDADCCGVDVNETELLQAAKLFNNEKLCFVYADITSDAFMPDIKADAIILASALQYFKEPKRLLSTLLKFLTPKGLIHILDTPFYHDLNVGDAKYRSKKYFAAFGHSEMEQYYFHHTLSVFRNFNYRIAHNPKSALNRCIRILNYNSPFYWITISP